MLDFGVDSEKRQLADAEGCTVSDMSYYCFDNVDLNYFDCCCYYFDLLAVKAHHCLRPSR